MGEAVDIYPLPALLLDAVVADCGGRRESFLHIAFMKFSSRLRRVRPDACVTVRLKLEPHRKLVGRCRVLLLRPPHFLLGAGEVLDMVPDLVRQDICLRKIPGGSKPAMKLVEE